MIFNLTWMNGFLLASMVIYFVFDFIDKRNIKDEREELIRLKSFEVVQKITILSLLVLSFACLFFPLLDGRLVILIIIMANLYSEIIAKIYLRNKL